MEFFETHAHYDDERFNKDREAIIDKIKNSGVSRCINVGCNIESSIFSVELAKKYDFIYAICGIHPSEIPQTEEELLKDIDKISGELIHFGIEEQKILSIDYGKLDRKKLLDKYLGVEE